jgi:hypothetical protein
MAAPQTLYAKSGNVQLAYQAIGAGPRDVVLDWAATHPHRVESLVLMPAPGLFAAASG